MKLPYRAHATIAESKITKYLLSTEHEDGRHKAAFFIRFGFSATDWRALADAFLRHVHEHEVTNVLRTKRGEHYTVEGALETPTGWRPLVRTVWMLELGSAEPRLITAYPVRRLRERRFKERIMIDELERVVLAIDVPEYHLTVGDIGTVVDISSDGTEYTVEFLTLDGETVAVVPIHSTDIRRIGHGEIAHVRALDRVLR